MILACHEFVRNILAIEEHDIFLQDERDAILEVVEVEPVYGGEAECVRLLVTVYLGDEGEVLHRKIGRFFRQRGGLLTFIARE